jgi:hypothetical protein
MATWSDVLQVEGEAEMALGRKKYLMLSMLWIFVVAPLLRAESSPDSPKTTIFRIGKFDRSSAEFSSGTPERNVTFVASQSDPAKEWYAVQPAVLSSSSTEKQLGISSAPRAITFSLLGSPASEYELHIAALIESASVPALKVVINSKAGLFYLHPQLDYNNGDQWDSFDPAYSSADVEFTFPGTYLRAGVNTITLQVVEQADEAVPDASLNYDAIELDSIPDNAAASDSAVQMVPTIFFRQQNGEMFEGVDAFIRRPRRLAAGVNAELILSRKNYRSALDTSYDFGDEKAEFWVHEFDPQTEAVLTLTTSKGKQNYKQTISPAKKWTIFVVPHIHVDVGYSDYQAKVAAIQSRTIDEAMDMTAKHPEFRFSLDGEWSLQQFLETRSAVEQQRAIEAIQKKQVFVPAQYANLLTGISTAETLIRSLYPSANFSRKYGTPLDYANITDVPSLSWSYASVLAAAGIPYLASGSDNYRAPVLLHGHLNESSPMWWVGPDGKKVLLWYSRHYMHMQMLFGLPPVLSAGRDTLPLFLQMYENAGYHANSTILYGTQVENTDLFPQQAELVEKWNRRYAYPLLRYSGFHEALEDIEKQFGDALPIIRGDGGPYWEDGAASDACYLAMERWNEARAQTAEKLDTVASLANPQLKADPDELGRMWTNMVLMDEHTFDSWNSVSDPTSKEAVDQLAFKEQFATNAAAQVDYVTRRTMANLADAIPAGPGSIIVFNSLNWKRNGLVTTDLNKSDEILDLSAGRTVPYEILAKGKDFIRVRFLAQDLPPLGYKVYVARQSKKVVNSPAREQGTSLESPYYKVELDPETGAVRSIYDKQLHRELVSHDGQYRFGQYLYVTGGDKEPNAITVYGHLLPKPALEIHPAHDGHIVSIERTPYGEIAHMESVDLNTPLIKSEIRVFDDEKKIEFTEEVNKNEVYTKEAAYFAFPFSFSQPQFQYEVQNGVVDPAHDMYPGAGHEWFSVQHWISAQQDGMSATVLPLDAPLVTIGDINRGEWPEIFGKRPGTIFSYVMNNYWNTNYRAGQGGRFSFHYVVTSGTATDALSLSRLGWEEITPLETDIVTSQDKALAPPPSSQQPDAADAPLVKTGGDVSKKMGAADGSFLKIADSDLLLETWKPAEDGHGSILRFLDFGGAERTVSVQIPWLRIDHVWQTDALERGQESLPIGEDDQFHFTIHPHEILTIRAVGAGK